MTKEEATPSPTRVKLLIAGIAALVAAYIFGSLAWDRGSYWYYGLTLLSVYIGVRYLILGIKTKKNHE
jgi:hypothetical protein